MRFCETCGHQLDNNVKFCGNCGEPVNSQKCEANRTFYDGEIRKCRNCGEVINSFVLHCPSCGYELRGTSATSSVQRLYEELNKSTSTQERAQIIRNFPIPNAKEDIIEFMILASTNISGEAKKVIFEAWVSKFEQAYQKAKITLFDDPSFTQIEKIYKQTEKNITVERFSHATMTARKTATGFFKATPNPVIAISLFLLIFVNAILLLFDNWDEGLIFLDIFFITAICVISFSGRANGKKKKEQFSASVSSSKQDIPQARIPFDYISGTSDHYAVVEARFRQAGFTNITTISLRDLTLGVVTKDGSVDEIVINGKEISSYFRRKFDADVPVLITYHSMRN